MSLSDLQRQQIAESFAASDLPDLRKLPLTRRIRWNKVLSLIFILSVTPALLYWSAVHEGFRPGFLIASLVLAFFALLSTAVGYHRLYSHKSFQPAPLLNAFFLFFGASARSYSALKWANFHRLHHKYCDDPERDPYPIPRGLFFAHIGWIMTLEHKKFSEFLCPDLLKDRLVVWQHRHYKGLAAFHQYLMPLGVGFYFHAPVAGLAYLGFLKMFLAQHALMSVNSIGHAFGRKPYNVETSARDNHFVALISLGEGYHNFHHAFPHDYRAGVAPSSLDFGKWFIWSAEKIGAAKNLRRASVSAIEEAQRKSALHWASVHQR